MGKHARFFFAVNQSFFLNRLWTFADKQKNIDLHKQWGAFVLVNLAGLAISNTVIWTTGMFIHPLLAKVTATVVVFIWGYTISRRLIF